MALTETQEQALILIYERQLDSIGLALRDAVDELISLGLAGGPVGQWIVTAEGRRLAERLTAD